MNMDSTPDKTHLMDAEEISALIDKIAQEICDKNRMISYSSAYTAAESPLRNAS